MRIGQLKLLILIGEIIGLYLGCYNESEQDVLSSGYQLHQIDSKQGYGGVGYFGIHFANDPSLTYLYEMKAYLENKTHTMPKKTNKKPNAKFENYKLVATRKIDAGTEILVNYFSLKRYQQEETRLRPLFDKKVKAARQAQRKRKRQLKRAATNKKHKTQRKHR